MTTPCPLYYDAADFMAAFSRGMEAQQIPMARADGSGRRLRAPRPRFVARISQAVRTARQWRPGPRRAAAGLAVRVQTSEPVSHGNLTAGERQARDTGVRRQGLTSHFALLAAAD